MSRSVSAVSEVPAGAALDAPSGVSGSPGWAFFGPLGKAWVMVPDELDERWQAAYQAYGQASENVSQSKPGDPDAARLMAAASWEVSVLWREIAATPGLPWWALASVRAAAQAFEAQSRDWNARADAGSGLPVRRGTRTVSARRRDGGTR